ncbi:hypothetical protein BC834DRAFT_655260 [Gloeopeniophorella convolvens]|nr:hypothetical protein BC834DRAFT_655260 [Gloeopeniophorella convolvens]
MPLFSPRRHDSPPPPPRPATPPNRSRSLFSRRSRSAERIDNRARSGTTYSGSNGRSPTNDYNSYGDNSRQGGSRSGGFFSRRRSSSSSDTRPDLAHDPSIMNARSKVSDAEAAEREADQALVAARMAVREARDHVRVLENEATEDARRAKMKQAEAKNVSKSARGLGRHG